MTVSKVEADSAQESEGHGSSDRRGYQAWTQSLPAGRMRTIVSKLFTNEDNMQLHKILGILSVVSFLYRYFYVYPTTGTLGFDGRWIDHATIFLHMALSTSSLIFHVIRRRLLNRPMIIWEEYRLHAIVFSTRCMSVYAMGTFNPFKGTLFEHAMIPLVVLAHHVGADMITQKYGSKDGVTTVRVRDGHRAEITTVLRFYAFYQFAALASHLTPNARLADLGFNTFIAIQSSAFLMTLYRKGVITEISHAFWYTTCLIISLFHIFRNCGNAMFIAKLGGAYILRTDYKMDKYVLWLSFALLSVPAVTDLITAKLMEITGDSFGASSIEHIQWACNQHDLLSQFCGINGNITA
mmetsp:Transcript_26735/g.53499  ORF Transcript_26735/g.53499 Transcript_26735/m.53499 type:complete len:352 (-) Transcript_26735:405-1460(-)